MGGADSSFHRMNVTTVFIEGNVRTGGSITHLNVMGKVAAYPGLDEHLLQYRNTPLTS